MLRNWVSVVALAVGLCAVGDVSFAADDPAQVEFFEKKIRSVLVEHCDKCHSGKAASLKGGLRVDFREGLMKGGESGPAVVVGKPDESLLILALKYDGFEMPPKGKLPDSVIKDFETWVKNGAVDPRETPATVSKERTINFEEAAKFWAFQAPQKHAAAAVKDDSLIKSDLDRFVQARLEAKELSLSPAADRRTLIRRAYLDLIGIPPTPEEVNAFLKDESPDAFATVVNTLLDSPHYGERWGRRWLDVARYGEDQAHTFKARNYPLGYLYRDWVIRSFNEDLPYDRFLTWQIAGDLLDEPNRHERLAALGMFALGPVYYAENVEKDRAAADEWDDRIDTLTRGVLGLTVSCARCHDHKFDPITTQDYYGLAGIFSSTNYQERPAVSDEVVASRRSADEAVKQKQLEIDRFLLTESRGVRPTLIREIPDYFVAGWKMLHRRKSEKNEKKLLEQLSKETKLSQTLIKRWFEFLKPGSRRSESETAALAEWLKLAAAEDDKKDLSKDEAAAATVRTLGEEFQKLANEKSPRHKELFARFGDNVAFANAADLTDVRAGVIPLGNLFDDSASVSLDAAVKTDKFSAVANADRLGVDRVAQGWGTRTKIAPDVDFDFRKLGSSSHSYGSIVNDGWQAGGAIRTQGSSFSSGKRVEQGIGMHANALITFDIDEIRKAGLLPSDQSFKFKVDRAGINDDTLGSNGSSHVAVLVTRPHKDKAVSDAVLAAFVNGKPVEVDVDDFTYYFSGDPGEPIRADGKFVSFDIPIPPEAKHLTLVTTGASEPDDNPISSDHAVFSGARLELDPLPEEKLAAKDDAGEPVDEEQLNRDQADAIFLSRLFYDEGLLALPANEAEGKLADEQKAVLAELKSKHGELNKAAGQINILMAHSLNEGNGADLPIYLQGNPAKKGDVAPRAMPAIFTSGEKSAFAPKGSGRLELAKSIASPGNPLTARVIVNRVWAGHFGVGLVKTTSNFGKLGDRPTHPQLLDWLAVRFVEQGWSLKQLHRDIMLSATYQQASDFREDGNKIDPENTLLWRMNRRRLEVEPWRDSILAVSGELDRTLGGPSANLDNAGFKRRTVYGFVSRHRLDELLRLFDFPDPNITAADRSVTTVPLQQLFVLNSDFMTQRARALTNRVSTTGDGAAGLADDESKVRYAYELLFGREARDDEVELATLFLQSGVDDGDKLSRWEQLALALLSSNEFLFVD
ncbi:MAG: DUF1553 domain-containing protein [Planctomycetota bacterium]|nr:DUF1553 domain-containing protein [Planctomycetota bacterium]